MSGGLFVISAPSGTGKTRLLDTVMQKVSNLVFSISHTTRDPRPGEQDGVDYHFVTREHFLELVENGDFLEFAEVHNNLYGTSHRAITSQLSQGVDVVLDIDVKGASILRGKESVDAVQIFIAPPNLVELEKRLRGRGTEDEETISVRLQNAKEEMRAANQYDYIMVNDDFEEACEVLTAVIIAERARKRRFPSGTPIELTL